MIINEVIQEKRRVAVICQRTRIICWSVFVDRWAQLHDRHAQLYEPSYMAHSYAGGARLYARRGVAQLNGKGTSYRKNIRFHREM